MKKYFLCILIIYFVIQAYSIEIRLLDQSIISGKLLTHKHKTYYIENNKSLYLVKDNAVDKLTKVSNKEFNIISTNNKKIIINYDEYIKSYVIDKGNLKGKDIAENDKNQYQRKNIVLLPAGITMLALSYDYLDKASNFHKSQKDKISKHKTLGYIFLGSGALTTLIAFNRVRVYTNYNTIAISYKF